MRSTTLAALALAGLVTGCSKEEPTPPPAATSERAAEAPSTPPVEEKTAEPAKPLPPADPGAQPGATPSTAVEPTAIGPAGTIVKMAPMTLGDFPEHIATVFGTPSLDSLVTAVVASARTFDPGAIPPDPMTGLREAVRIQFGLESAEWIDATRPVRVAIPDPKAYPDGFIAIVPFTGDADAARKALGDQLTPAQGHEGSLRAAGRTVYVDFIGTRIAFSSHDDVLAESRAWIDETLLKWTPPYAVSLEASITNLRKAYAAEVVAARRMVDMLGARVAAQAGSQLQVQALQGMVDSSFEFVENADRLAFGVMPVGDEVALALAIRGVDGTTLAKQIAGVAEREAAGARDVPQDAWFAVVSDTPSTVENDDRAELTAMLTSADAGDMQMTAEEAKRVVDAVAELGAVSTGESVFGVRVADGFPMAIEAAIDVTDGARARAALDAVLAVAWGKLMARLTAEARAAQVDPSALQGAGVADVVGIVNQMGARAGLTLAVEDAERDGARIAGLSVAIDWDKSGLGADPSMAPVRALVGDRVEIGLVTTGGRIAVALGPKGIARAEALARNAADAGGTPDPTLAAASKGAFMAGTLRPGPLLAALSKLPALASIAEGAARLPNEAFVGRASSDGETFVFQLDVPLELLIGLMNLR